MGIFIWNWNIICQGEKTMKPFFTQTTQIGIVVKDLDATLERYVQKYGIGPWQVYTFDNKNVDKQYIGHKPADYKMKLALCMIGKTMWELIQPISDNTDYVRFLKEHGEGIHHVAIGVEKTDDYFAFCSKNSLYPIQGGTWKCIGGNFVYDYRDTREDLKVIVELHAPDKDIQLPEPDYAYPDYPMPRKPVFTDVLQVGIICKDLKKTITSYTDKYGIGPWNRYLFDKDTVGDMKRLGKKVNYAMDLALAQVGNVQWELIQPLDDKSDYAVHLREHGEGIHHVALETAEKYHDALAFFDGNNIRQVQYGYWNNNFHYDYRDTRDDMKCIVELYGPDASFTWPDPLAVYTVPAS
jgi:catechol 2,3-dioxygenase-like lactoylglutathione lyase family enzyme